MMWFLCLALTFTEPRLPVLEDGPYTIIRYNDWLWVDEDELEVTVHSQVLLIRDSNGVYAAGRLTYDRFLLETGNSVYVGVATNNRIEGTFREPSTRGYFIMEKK